jgi:hypothetical protein
MLKRLAAIFSRPKGADRRRSTRLKARFRLVVVRGAEEFHGTGLDLSLNGCLIAMAHPPDAPQFKAILEIGDRRITVSLNAVRTGTTVVDGAKLTTLGCSFSGVARDDYAQLVEFHKRISTARA